MPSHYPNKCWVIVKWTLRNKLQWNFNQNTKLFIHTNTSEYIVCEMAAILSRGDELRWLVIGDGNSFSVYHFSTKKYGPIKTSYATRKNNNKQSSYRTEVRNWSPYFALNTDHLMIYLKAFGSKCIIMGQHTLQQSQQFCIIGNGCIQI